MARPEITEKVPPDAQTMSVPQAGKFYFDLSRNGSYQAAKEGIIPAIKVGRLLRVPVRQMERMLDGAQITTVAATRFAKRKRAKVGA